MSGQARWRVEVHVDGENILSIRHDALVGKPYFTDDEADVIRRAGESLRSFIGDKPLLTDEDAHAGTPDHVPDAGKMVAGTPEAGTLRDDSDVPLEMWRLLMDIATAHGAISYYWLLDIYRKQAARLPAGTPEGVSLDALIEVEPFARKLAADFDDLSRSADGVAIEAARCEKADKELQYGREAQTWAKAAAIVRLRLGDVRRREGDVSR